MKLVIYGIGPFAKLLHYYLTNDSDYEVVAFCADEAYIKEKEFCGLPIVAFEDVEDIYKPKEYKMLVAVGYSKMRNRKIMFEKAKAKNYALVNYIHSSVINHEIKLGENNIILAGCVIEPNVEIGNNNVIWSMTLLGHDCQIENHNYISAKCLISGDTKIKNLCFIGNGTTMINGLVIENETYLIAGTNLRKSTKEYGMYIGNPAKFLKLNQSGIVIK
ncbi:MAG: acetyltransferase [Arcobacteraceae bacterium]